MPNGASHAGASGMTSVLKKKIARTAWQFWGKRAYAGMRRRPCSHRQKAKVE
jgi:hypothetical protein